MTAGAGATCATRDDSGLLCWGANFVDQLGVGDLFPRFEPTPVGHHVDWKAASVGFLHACGVRAGGALFCWGYSGYGVLGHEKSWVPSPLEVPDPRAGARAARARAYAHPRQARG